MDKAKRLVITIGLVLVGLGVLSLAVSLSSGGKINISLPLVFLLLGAICGLMAPALTDRWSWSPLLYLPGALLCALGLIFLLNVITSDWNAWAYAWLLILVGFGFGMILANASLHWRPLYSQVGVGLVIGGLILFALFGAIAGGLFIQIMAPILLVAGGAGLYWIKPEAILPARLLARWRIDSTPQGGPASLAAPDQQALVEPLSSRELEVLRLIDEGLSNPDIARRLTLAPSTVKTHINNIYGKLGVENRVQALKRARDLGLLAQG